MLYSEKNSRTLHNLPYTRSGIRHFAADLPYFEEQVRGQIWALIYLIAEEVPRECPRAFFVLTRIDGSMHCRSILAHGDASTSSLRIICDVAWPIGRSHQIEVELTESTLYLGYL
jgi:hypothetical protein